MPAKLEEGAFFFDAGAEDESGRPRKYAGMHNPTYRWNGWACPHFKVEAIREMMEPEGPLNNEYCTAELDGDRLTLTLDPGGCPIETVVIPFEAGLYDLGDLGWTWNCSDDEDDEPTIEILDARPFHGQPNFYGVSARVAGVQCTFVFDASRASHHPTFTGWSKSFEALDESTKDDLAAEVRCYIEASGDE